MAKKTKMRLGEKLIASAKQGIEIARAQNLLPSFTTMSGRQVTEDGIVFDDAGHPWKVHVHAGRMHELEMIPKDEGKR